MTKATKLIVSYQGGSKDGHVEEIRLAEVEELTIGRDSSSVLRFDENEDLVSRNHAKIVPRGDDKSRLEVFDLGSRSGTFVNQQRVADTMAVRSGDVVQLGAGGPELKIELDSKPSSAAKTTRLAGTPAATRVAGTPAPAAEEVGKPEVGKATVERMIADTKQKSNRQKLTVAAAILAVVALVVIFMLVQ